MSNHQILETKVEYKVYSLRSREVSLYVTWGWEGRLAKKRKSNQTGAKQTKNILLFLKIHSPDNG